MLAVLRSWYLPLAACAVLGLTSCGGGGGGGGDSACQRCNRAAVFDQNGPTGDFVETCSNIDCCEARCDSEPPCHDIRLNGLGQKIAETCDRCSDGGGPRICAPTPTPTLTRTLVPTRTPTPIQQASVCDGVITSVPKVCSLAPHDAGVIDGVRYMTFGFCASDLEGDVDKQCVGVSIAGTTLQVQCTSVTPAGSLLNSCTETGPIAIGQQGSIALWQVIFDLRDRAGHVSNTESTTFSCCE